MKKERDVLFVLLICLVFTLLTLLTFYFREIEVEEPGVFFAPEPDIFFVAPTPANGSVITQSNFIVNVSAQDDDGHYSFLDFNNSLILWMRMDDLNASGDPVDLSGRGNNGVLNDGGDFSLVSFPGYYGNGFRFDGANDIIELPSGMLNGKFNEITISTWINRSFPNRQIMSNHESGSQTGFSFFINVNGNIDLGVYNGTNFFGVSSFPGYVLPLGELVHIAAVKNRYELRLYVNGVLLPDIQPMNSSIAASSFPLHIGCGHSAGGGCLNPFRGVIDEVLIFDQALEAGEILSLYNSSANQYMNNFTNLSNGEYKFTGYSVDVLGNRNQTKERVVIVSVVPGIEILQPVNESIVSVVPNANNLTSINATFNLTNYATGGKGQDHVHFQMSNNAGFNFSDVFMFYNSPDNVVEIGLNPGVTGYATWIDQDSLQFNNVSLGIHQLRAFLANGTHNPIGNAESDTTINFTITRTSICGNNFVDAGEECDDGNINNDDGCDSFCRNESNTNQNTTGGGSSGGVGGGSTGGGNVSGVNNTNNSAAQPTNVSGGNLSKRTEKEVSEEDPQKIDIGSENFKARAGKLLFWILIFVMLFFVVVVAWRLVYIIRKSGKEENINENPAVNKNIWFS